MSFMKGAPGCCCCKLVYYGMGGRMMNLAKFDAPNLQWKQSPIDTSAIVGAYYHLDHYHNLLFEIGSGLSPAIKHYSPKLPDASTDVVKTTVLTGGGSQTGVAVSTISEESKVVYVVRDSSANTSRYVREVGFDGTGDTAKFTITVNNSAELLRQFDHCRADDRIYYNSTATGNSRPILRACARDGTGTTIVFDPGTGLSVNAFNSFTFDNVREKIYAMHQYSGGGGKQAITRFNLDGSDQEEIYLTNTPISPSSLNRISGVAYSHKDDKLYWWQSGNLAGGADADTDDPKGGMWCCEADGTNPTQLTNMREIAAGSAGDLQVRWSIGCGYETLGTGTHA